MEGHTVVIQGKDLSDEREAYFTQEALIETDKGGIVFHKKDFFVLNSIFEQQYAI